MADFYDKEKRDLLKAKSAFILPANPSNKGFSADQIRRTLYEPSLYLFDLLKVRDTTIDGIFNELRDNLNTLDQNKTNKTDFDFVNVDLSNFAQLSTLSTETIYKGIVNGQVCLFTITKLTDGKLSVKVLFNSKEKNDIFGQEIIITNTNKVEKNYTMCRLLDFSSLTTLSAILTQISHKIVDKDLTPNVSWLVKYNTNDLALVFAYFIGENSIRYSIVREGTLYDGLVMTAGEKAFIPEIDNGIKAHFENIIADLKSKIDYLNNNVVLTVKQDLIEGRKTQARENIGVINGGPIIKTDLSFVGNGTTKITSDLWENINKYDKCYLETADKQLFVLFKNETNKKTFTTFNGSTELNHIIVLVIDSTLNAKYKDFTLADGLQKNTTGTKINLIGEEKTFGNAIDVKTINKTSLLETGDLSLIPTSEKGKANGVATLGNNGLVIPSQLPGGIDEIKEGHINPKNDTEFILEDGTVVNSSTPDVDKIIFFDTNSNKSYRWTGSRFKVIASDLALGYTHESAFYGDEGLKNTKNIETLNNSKLDKATEQEIAYTTDNFGNQTTTHVNVDVYGDGIVKRTRDGQVKGANATANDDLVPKQQLDTLLANKQNTLKGNDKVTITPENELVVNIVPNDTKVATEVLGNVTFGKTTYTVTPNVSMSLSDEDTTGGFFNLKSIKITHNDTTDTWKIIDEKRVQEIINNTLSGVVNKEY